MAHVLVETENSIWALETREALEADGHVVEVCRDLADRGTCPLIEGHACERLERADLVVNAVDRQQLVLYRTQRMLHPELRVVAVCDGPRAAALQRILADTDTADLIADSRELAARLDQEDTAQAVLSRGSIGRLAFLHKGRPQILPLAYALTEQGALVFRTGGGAKVHAAERDGAGVAFEVTEVVGEIALSVTVTGRLTPILDLVHAQVLVTQTDLHPWADATARETWLHLTPERVVVRAFPDRSTLVKTTATPPPEPVEVVPTDHAGLEVLAPDQCYRLLATTPVGRVAFAANGEVSVLPVNHALHGGDIVFRSAQGDKLGSAAMQRVVAFEVDDYDVRDRSGWSVLVHGTAQEVWDEDDLVDLDSLGLHPWATSRERDHWIRIRPDTVTGRRIIR